MKSLALLFVLVPALGSAQAPQKVPAKFGYQGRLLDRTGAALNGTHQVTFSIYKQPTGGSALWSETQKLALTSGFYSTFLGAVTPLPVNFDSTAFPVATVFDGSDLYLGVAVDGTEELTPRQQIGAVVYALRTAWAVRARDADHADEATHAASATSAGSATNATNAGYATNAGHADGAVRADSAGYADSAGHAASAGTATNVSGGNASVGALNATSATIGYLKGLVVGGGSYVYGDSTTCDAWGTGECYGPIQCPGGGTPRGMGSSWLCVQ